MATAPKNSGKKSIQQQTLDMINAAPLVGMNAAAPRMSVGITNLGTNVLGGVDRRSPDLVMINQNLADPAINIGMKHTIPHEFEHVLQNQASKVYEKSYDMQVADAYNSLGGSQDKLVDALKKSAVSTKLKSHLESIIGTPVAPYLGAMHGGQFSLAEQFAELSAVESAARKDLTADPVVRKEFFQNDQALIDVYKATTGFRTTRTDARDLQPMTAIPTPVAAAPSVLDQIFDAARKILK